jgi:uncharacterized protein YeaO (DUF488 family)
MTKVARVYDARSAGEGLHVLVDRLWPRGIRKDDPRIDAWWRDLAPSAELRTWFGHRAERFEEFAVRYEEELGAPALADVLERARAADAAEGLTLLTATRDMAITHANVLARVIDEG